MDKKTFWSCSFPMYKITSLCSVLIGEWNSHVLYNTIISVHLSLCPSYLYIHVIHFYIQHKTHINFYIIEL